MDAFPGSEDYEHDCSPVRDLTLLEQVEYWKARSRLAEELAQKQRDIVSSATDTNDIGLLGDGDWWKAE